MIPPQLRGSMMEAKAQHLRFDILEEKKGKNQAPKCVQET